MNGQVDPPGQTRVQFKIGFNSSPGLYARKYGINHDQIQSLYDNNFFLILQDFLKAAENLESQVTSPNNASSKRQSFELGGPNPDTKRARVSPQSSSSTLSPIISYAGGQNKTKDIQASKPNCSSQDPLGLNDLFSVNSKSTLQKDRRISRDGGSNIAGIRSCNTEPLPGKKSNNPATKKVFQFKSPQNPRPANFQNAQSNPEELPNIKSHNPPKNVKSVNVQTKLDEAQESPNLDHRSQLLDKDNSQTKRITESMRSKVALGMMKTNQNVSPQTSTTVLPALPESCAKSTSNIFSQSTIDSELDLSLDDLSPWKPGKTFGQKTSSVAVNSHVNRPDNTEKSVTDSECKTASLSVSSHVHKPDNSKKSVIHSDSKTDTSNQPVLRNIPASLQNILATKSSGPLKNHKLPERKDQEENNTFSILQKTDSMGRSVENSKISQDTLSLPSTLASLDSSFSAEPSRGNAPCLRQDGPISPTKSNRIPETEFLTESPIPDSIRPKASSSKSKFQFIESVKRREDTPRPTEQTDESVGNFLRSRENRLPSTSNIQRPNDNLQSRDNTRSNADPLRSSEEFLRPRGDVQRSQDICLRPRSDSIAKPIENPGRARSHETDSTLQTPVMTARRATGFERKTLDTSTKSDSPSTSAGVNKRKRKFPGPAGVLPKLVSVI